MKNLVFAIWVVLLLTLFLHQAKAQDELRFTDSTESSMTLPFKLSQNLMIISVSINGTGPMNFVLDSGISNTIITELTGVDSLQLNHTREVYLSGLGSGEAGKAYTSTGNILFLENPDAMGQGIIAENHPVYLLEEDHFSLSNQLGMQVNGLIGADFFSNFTVEINYHSKLITFHNPETFFISRRYRKYKEIPVTLSGTKAFVEASIVQGKDEPLPVMLMLDTGASLPAWLAEHTSEQIRIPEKTIPAMLGQGLNGIISGVNGRIAQLVLGGYTFHNPIISYPDSLSVATMIESKGRNGSLGNDILRRFHIIFDYPENRLLIYPNRSFKDPFTYNRSGLEIEKPLLNLPAYTVFHVTEGSPADLAGIQAGDQLIMVNHFYTRNLLLDEINSYLHGKHGKIIRLRLNRNGESLKVRFRLSTDL